MLHPVETVLVLAIVVLLLVIGALSVRWCYVERRLKESIRKSLAARKEREGWNQV